MTIIRSKFFLLRSLKKEDEESLAENANDKTVFKNTLRIPYPYTLKDAKWWVNYNLKLEKKKERHEIVFGISIDGKVVGCVGLDRIHDGCAELGYWLGKDYRRQGIMTEAVGLVSNYAFRKMKLRRIYVFVFPWNKASVSVIKNNGYKYEGKLRKHVKKGNKFVDDLLFAKVR